jgi:hypothetical protein
MKKKNLKIQISRKNYLIGHKKRRKKKKKKKRMIIILIINLKAMKSNQK